MIPDKFSKIDILDNTYDVVDISTIDKIDTLPFSYRVLIENIIRQKLLGKNKNADSQVKAILENKIGAAINFAPNRILSHDILGKVMLVDFLAYREALQKKGVGSKSIQPDVPVDVVIDHSLQVDFFGDDQAKIKNLEKEYERNSERFSFLRWCSKYLDKVNVIPPGVGICHQVNIEHLSKVVWREQKGNLNIIHPDTCIGTDSHTPMVNAIGVVGWGVGGVEAEISMLGRTIPMTVPEVVGVNLKNSLQEGITSTDLVLHVTKLLRDAKVVGSFIEFFGQGVETLTVGDRATISNMAPEFGATNVLFPVDDETIEYLKMTGRTSEELKIVEEYSKKQKLWRKPNDNPKYNRILELDLNLISPCVSGPRNPEDKINLDKFSNLVNEHSQLLYKKDLRNEEYEVPNLGYKIKDADIMIAAITSCTNTANPKNVIAAGLIAKKLVELGFKRNKMVKTSFAPGSKVTAEILKQTGLQNYLDQLGFNVVGIGCTTCNGSSGPLDPNLAEIIEKEKIFSTAVLSGNRNFQGRIHPNIRASYLASPGLIVLFSILGSIKKDLSKVSIGKDNQGKEVFFKDIWPANKEVNKIISKFYKSETFIEKYKEVNEGGELWEGLKVSTSNNYDWPESTYIRKPPYMSNAEKSEIKDIHLARPIALFGNSVTTDHISPSSAITKGTAAWDYLTDLGLNKKDFNNFLTRRANHEIVARSTFASLRLRNLMTPDQEGSITVKYPENEVMRLYDAAMEYKKEQKEIIVIAGENYGCGSSRDVAAKGPLLIGIKVIVAKGFERIHRSNLIGMGILPLQFKSGQGIDELEIKGSDQFSIIGLDKIDNENKKVIMKIHKEAGDIIDIELNARLDVPEELVFWKNGGILPTAYKEA
ncbi:MAG: aconitate hydratase AcnA [Pelagibacteraceae bacterium]|nr:aconitate hydratase AcnA [Pelagibacteraceae bacterium]|tara:strand:+ start:541 stop:3168 length:2628 start_codon:yes stop_codon:yes gene_type:complete